VFSPCAGSAARAAAQIHRYNPSPALSPPELHPPIPNENPAQGSLFSAFSGSEVPSLLRTAKQARIHGDCCDFHH
jgi:hypothetical protein